MYNNMQGIQVPLGKNKKIKKSSGSIYIKTYIFGLAFSFLFIPFFAYAATTYSQDLFGLFEYAKDIIDDLVLWLFTTGAVLFFMGYLAWKVYTGADKPDDRKKIYTYILYGLIALTLMFTFYAVSGLIATTFGIQLGIPQFFQEQTGLTPGSGNVDKTYSVIGN